MDLRARWVFTVGILYLLPEGRRLKWSCEKWMGSDKILVAICSVLDLYNCSKLVTGVQHPAILQEMVYIQLISIKYEIFHSKTVQNINFLCVSPTGDNESDNISLMSRHHSHSLYRSNLITKCTSKLTHNLHL